VATGTHPSTVDELIANMRAALEWEREHARLHSARMLFFGMLAFAVITIVALIVRFA